MSRTCANCQAENADGARFCNVCGAPFPAAAATPSAAPLVVTEPPATTPPVPGVASPTATASTSPSNSPPGGGSGVRVPMVALAGGVAAAVLVAAIVGVAIGGASGPGATATPHIPTPLPTVVPAPTTSVPATAVPVTPGPVVTAPPSGGTGGAGGQAPTQTIENDVLSVIAPGDWPVNKTANVIDLTRPADGELIIQGGQLKARTTVAAKVQAIIDEVTAQSPDAKECNDRINGHVNGWPSVAFVLCYTAETKSGQAYQAFDFYDVALASDGETLFEVELYDGAEDWNNLEEDFVNDVRVTWNLPQGPS